MNNKTIVVVIFVLAITLIGLIMYKKSDSTTDTFGTNKSTATPSASPTAQAVTKAADLVDPADVVSAHKVVLKTNKGDIAITLFPEDSPKTVKNFVTLGKRGFYDNLIFHRIIQDFMIQGGDPKGNGTGGSSIFGEKFPDEINSHKIVRGSLAMANSGPNTNGSQFFIVTTGAQSHLDGLHVNFGQVDEASMSVVAAIAGVQVDRNDKPLAEVKITGFEITQP